MSHLSSRQERRLPLRVQCIIHALDLGGAQRMAADFAGSWARAGYTVSLVTTDARTEDFYSVESSVPRTRLDLAGSSANWRVAIRANFRRIRALRRAIVEASPDIVVSFIDTSTILCVFATLGLGIPVVGFESSDPTNPQSRRSLPWRLLRRLAYARAAAITVLTSSIRARLAQWRPRVRLALIPNPVPAELLAMPGPTPCPDTGRKRLVAIGRLDHAKGFDMLLSAFPPLAARFPDWDLWIWGEGEERAELERAVQDLDLVGRVFLPGSTRSPWDELGRASLCVLPSRREGFPGALVEAMALGRACVAFDCMSGPREISRDGEDAVLVPASDVAALSAALAELMGDPGRRAALGERARKVRERYHPTAIAAQWEDLFQAVLERRTGVAEPQGVVELGVSPR
jgi:glycosyltransferase involved in cell wall biosynthesis